MDDEVKKKVFEIHGTTQRLEQKTDDILKTQGRLEKEVDNLDNEVNKVDKKAQKNRKRIYAVYIVSGVLATIAGIISNVLPKFLSTAK